jgi:hypothetical protein
MVVFTYLDIIHVYGGVAAPGANNERRDINP